MLNHLLSCSALILHDINTFHREKNFAKFLNVLNDIIESRFGFDKKSANIISYLKSCNIVVCLVAP